MAVPDFVLYLTQLDEPQVQEYLLWSCSTATGSAFVPLVVYRNALVDQANVFSSERCTHLSIGVRPEVLACFFFTVLSCLRCHLMLKTTLQNWHHVNSASFGGTIVDV